MLVAAEAAVQPIADLKSLLCQSEEEEGSRAQGEVVEGWRM